MQGEDNYEEGMINQWQGKEKKRVLLKGLPSSEIWWLTSVQHVQGIASNSIWLKEDVSLDRQWGSGGKACMIWSVILNIWSHWGNVSVTDNNLAQVGVWVITKSLLSWFRGNMMRTKSQDTEMRLQSEFEDT